MGLSGVRHRRCLSGDPTIHKDYIVRSETFLENFVWTAFDRAHGGQRKRRPSGFTDINCPMCVARGTSADRRYRCGVKASAVGVGVNCFNCDFKAGWTLGRPLSHDMKEFLRGVGVTEKELAAVAAKAALHQRHAASSGLHIVHQPAGFAPTPLPSGSRPIDEWVAEGCTEADFLAVCEYLLTRGDEVAAWAGYHWSPASEDGLRRRLIIPFEHRGQMVGYTARSIDPGVEPRYVSRKQPDFLFNNCVLEKRKRKYLIVVEGAFDALAVDGVALLGSTVTARQAAWLKSTGQTVIIVPDRDEAGEKLIDAAVHHGWRVAFPCTKCGRPWWDRDVKDVAEATKRYGRLWTTLSLIKSSTPDASEIEIAKRLFR